MNYNFPSFIPSDPPTVRIEGYDDNWYMGRKNVVLKCHVDANPKAFNVTWTT